MLNSYLYLFIQKKRGELKNKEKAVAAVVVKKSSLKDL
jgi:hypothetical protein